MKTVNDYKYSQRAVAPIIATLLMVAISVVGGILIFVFAQGFFTDTNIGTPTIESIEIFGYDARDQAALEAHNDDPTIATDDITVSVAASGNLKTDDAIVLYVRNKGGIAITIDKIKVYGIDYTWDVITADTALTTGTPGAKKEFAVSIVLGTKEKAAPVIDSGQEATIIIKYDETDTGKVKIGRPIPVVIHTGGGATFTKQLQNGVQVG